MKVSRDGHRPYSPMPVRSIVKCVEGKRSAAAVHAVWT